jgi:hypothetical protein
MKYVFVKLPEWDEVSVERPEWEKEVSVEQTEWDEICWAILESRRRYLLRYLSERRRYLLSYLSERRRYLLSRFQWFAAQFAESSCLMWRQAKIRPKNEKISKKFFSLQWPLSYFDVIFF